ncbi:hypothetical protein ACTQ6A_13760 [Lachnospiraceae bacterium LCP25S3_G4]
MDNHEILRQQLELLAEASENCLKNKDYESVRLISDVMLSIYSVIPFRKYNQMH